MKQFYCSLFNPLNNMKNLFLIPAFLFISLAIISCKKPGDAPAGPVTIIGRWNLISDSAYIQVWFPLQDGSSAYKYIGVSMDYYDFEANGKFSWYEQNSGLDTASYDLITSNKIYINWYSRAAYSPNGPDPGQTFNITTLTAHSLILNSGPLPLPEGVDTEIITLSR